MVAGGLAKLTARGYMKQQLPQLKQRVSERASSSRTKPRRKRTFAGLLPWERFADEVEEFIEGREITVAQAKEVGLEAELGDELLFQVFYRSEDDDRAQMPVAI